MFALKVRRIPAHHHPDPGAGRIDAAVPERLHHRRGMLLKRPPGQADLEEEGRKEEVEVPGGGELDEEKGGGEERRGQNGSRNTASPLDTSRVAARDSPPPDEPTEERHRMVTGVRVPDQPIHQQRRGDYDRCRNHARMTPRKSAANAAAFKRSTR